MYNDCKTCQKILGMKVLMAYFINQMNKLKRYYMSPRSSHTPKILEFSQKPLIRRKVKNF